MSGESGDNYSKHCWIRPVEHISRAINTTDISIRASSLKELDQ